MKNLAQMVLETLHAAPEAPALIRSGQVTTRGELHSRVVALAAVLHHRGLRSGERVVIQLPNGIELVAATLAVISLGGVPVLLEGGLGDAVYLSRIGSSSARWLVVHPLLRRLGQAPRLRHLIARAGVSLPPHPEVVEVLEVSARSLDRLVQHAAAAPGISPQEASDPCMIVFTGGTTRAPRGVLHTHGSIHAFLESIRSVLDLAASDRLVVDTLPQALYAIYLGLTAHIASGAGPKRAAHVLSLMRSGAVQVYFGAPYLWQEMMRLADAERMPSSLRMVLLGSAPVTPRFLQQLRSFLAPQTEVVSLYGMTEAGPVCISSAKEKLAWSREGDLVGRPVPGMRVDIDAAPGELGEVLLWGDSVCAGYLNEPPRPAGEPLRTGDLGRLIETDAGPVLVLLGRIKEMIIRRGVNLYPTTLEAPILALAAARGVALSDCAMIGVWDEASGDERVVLCVVTAPDVDLEQVHRIAAEATGADGAPDQVVAVASIPVKGRQNKRDLSALRAQIQPPIRLPSLAERLSGAVIPFGFSAFAEKYRTRLRTERAPVRVLAEAGLRLGLWAVSQGAWALDEVVAPRWRSGRGLGPVFIVGHQRSGTTFLHRLLASDTDHVDALTLQEMLLPAISLQSGLSCLDWLDRRLARPLGSRLDQLQERLLGPMDGIHRIRLGEVEEDEFVLWAIFSSIMVANDSPAAVEHRHLDRLRFFESWSQRQRERALGYYRDVLARKRYRSQRAGGTARWSLSKNPAFSKKILDLQDLFPQARFIYLVRDPLQAIPSRLSMLRAIWHRRFPAYTELTAAQAETIIEDSLRTYQLAERDLLRVAQHRRIVVQHTELQRDPEGVVRRIYAHFKLPGPGPVLAARLAALEPRATQRSIDLGDYAFDEDRIRAALPEVFERYGF